MKRLCGKNSRGQVYADVSYMKKQMTCPFYICFSKQSYGFYAFKKNNRKLSLCGNTGCVNDREGNDHIF